MIKISKRKKLTNDLFLFFEKKLFQLTNNNIKSGYIITFFHYILILFTFILIASKDNKKFYIGTILWIIITLLHMFFNGCIFIRLERYLWKNNDWVGPWTIIIYIFQKIFKINKKNNSQLLRYLYIFTSIIIYSYIFNRLN